MIIGYTSKFTPLSNDKLRNARIGSSNKTHFATTIFHRPSRVRCSHLHSTASSMARENETNYVSQDLHDGFEEAKEKIRHTFRKVELCPSCYDTAWVAMVPSRHSIKQPYFPQCLDWIIENQREDGSWGLNPSHPLLVKDSLSSTLACLLALTKWRVGDKQVERGLGFIETHGWAIDNKVQVSPVGFETIFPSMIKHAQKLNLNLSLDIDLVNLLNRERDSTIKRGDIEYIAEGFGELCNWKEIIMLHQRQNGSLFNSPATTAAALIYHQYDEKCFGYLNSILKIHKNWVPTIFPTKIHSLLCLVDTLQSLGVHQYFKSEIKEVLDETYRLWQLKDEDIFSNIDHCAMAFRLLRMSNYEVSSEELGEFVDEEYFFATSRKFTSHFALAELHKASQMAIHDEKDYILDRINNWTRTFMEQKLLNNDFLDRMSKKEVELALRKFYLTYDRAENRRYIESYEENNFKMLKAAYRCPNTNNIDLLEFSRYDFNLCQAQHQEELQQLKRWFKDCRLDHIGFPEEYMYTSYLIGVAVISEPEFSYARLVYVKYVILLTVVDDIFDCFSSKDELLNFIELVKRWDGYASIGCYSERIKVLFLAIYKTTEEAAAIAEINQGRSVKDHLTNLVTGISFGNSLWQKCKWLEGLKCMLQEVDWWTNKRTPSTEEYLSVACVTFGTASIVLTTQYFLGIKLPKDVIEGAEMNGLCGCTAIVCRLLNDLITYKRERGETTVNLVLALMAQSKGAMCEEEAVRQIKEIVETNRRQALGMVLQSNGSQLPQVCKDLFWNTIKAVYFFYSDHDEFRSPNKVKNHINQVIYKPISQSLCVK